MYFNICVQILVVLQKSCYKYHWIQKTSIFDCKRNHIWIYIAYTACMKNQPGNVKHVDQFTMMKAN